jgi:hypothetical protein
MKQWFKSFKSGVEDLLVGFGLTVCVYAFLLCFFRMLWALYCETQVCKIYTTGNPALFAAINDIMHESLVVFSFTSSMLAFKICLVIALASQLSMVKRFLYDSRGPLGKLLLFGIPCTAVVTWYSEASRSDVFFAFYLLPTMNLMGYCFKFIARVAPSLP